MVRHATSDITIDIIIIYIHSYTSTDISRRPKTRDPCAGRIMLRHIFHKTTIPVHEHL
jgi:hypothetical protein